MAKRYDELQTEHIDFIKEQHLFFVATAGAEGFVNLSPKGMDSLRVLSPQRVVWLNLTGSGNESAAHVLENARMTLMFCSFGRQPLILRLYGEAEVFYPRASGWEDLIAEFPHHPGARQLFDLDIKMVQTSCGFAVPYYEFTGERPTLSTWAEKRGEEGIRKYWLEKNARSLDGKKTGIAEEQEK